MEKTARDLSESTAPAAVTVESADTRPAGSSILGLIRMMLLDVGLPLVAYYGLHAVGVSDYRALLTGSVVAGLRVAFVALRSRRLDGFAAFLMALFASGSRCPSSPATPGSCSPRTRSAPRPPG